MLLCLCFVMAVFRQPKGALFIYVTGICVIDLITFLELTLYIRKVSFLPQTPWWLKRGLHFFPESWEKFKFWFINIHSTILISYIRKLQLSYSWLFMIIWMFLIEILVLCVFEFFSGPKMLRGKLTMKKWWTLFYSLWLFIFGTQDGGMCLS